MNSSTTALGRVCPCRRARLRTVSVSAAAIALARRTASATATAIVLVRLTASATATAVVLASLPASAAVTPAPGYVVSTQMLSAEAQSCVAAAFGGVFVGAGPAFTGNAEAIWFVTGSGQTSVVATGFNAIGDCLYDAATDTLYVTDNGLEAAGAVTGDTVYAIPSASTANAIAAAGLEIVPPGSIPSAASVALDAAGDLYVGDAAGFGAGSVRKISGTTMSTWIGGLDFVGGLAFDADGRLLVAQTLAPNFDSEVARYDAAGAPIDLLSGPTFAHGSFDLAIDLDGDVLVTGAFGGDVVALDAQGQATPFASGLAFATGATVDAFSGRVTLLSADFPVTVENQTLFHFTPVERLVAGKGSVKSECMSEWYGLELAPLAPGKPAKHAVCVDGQPCDADGAADGVCTFPLGVCLNVTDVRYPQCTPTEVLTAGVRAKPKGVVAPELEDLSAQIAAALPVTEPTCFFGDGVSVPLVVKKNGKAKPGKLKVKIFAERSGDKPHKDNDKVKLVCEPAGA